MTSSAASARRTGTDVVVAGGGVAGLCVALAAADLGLDVLLVDEGRPGAASRASAGMLAPGVGFDAGAAPLALDALGRYPAWAERLRGATGVDVALDLRGIIELAENDAELARLHAVAAAGAERLDARMLATLEPALGGHPGGVLHPGDGAVDPVRLVDALDRAVDLAPRIARVRGAVVALAPDGEGVRVATKEGATYAGRRVVLAAGAWVGGLRGLPRPLPVRPLRGELLTLATPALRHVVHGPGGYLIPRGDALLVGATNEDAGFDAETTEAGRRALAATAGRFAPALADAPVVRHWAGLRPMSPDGLPILGADPDRPEVVYACGYSRNGILFAPWAGERIGALLAGETTAELAVFRVDRFGTSR